MPMAVVPSSVSRTLAEIRHSSCADASGALHCIWWLPREASPSLHSCFFSSTSAATAASSSNSVPDPTTHPPPPPSFRAQDREGKSLWAKWFLFLPGAITFALGTWQIFRRQDKIEMLEYKGKRLGMEPLRYTDVSTANEKLDSLEFRKVVCKGFFDEKKSIYVGPRSRSISGITENGYYVITPLLLLPKHPDSVQFPVLVNRGWVPRCWKDKSKEVTQDREHLSSVSPAPSKDGIRSPWWRFWSEKQKITEEQTPAVIPVEVVGVVRGSEKPSIFVPPNDPNSSQWFYVDVPAIARASGLPETTLYIEDIRENIDPSHPYPVPKDVDTLIRSSVMPQDHLNYTLTWYSLSAAVTFMAFKRLKQKSWR